MKLMFFIKKLFAPKEKESALFGRIFIPKEWIIANGYEKSYQEDCACWFCESVRFDYYHHQKL